MEIFPIKYNTKQFSMFFLFDNHEGNANHNRDAWLRAINYIKKTSEKHDTAVILGGDMADCIDIKDWRFSPAEICKEYSIRDLKDLPRKQFQRVYNDLKQIKHLIKAAVVGNHEESYIKHNGFDVYDYLCTDLIGCYKLGYEGVIRLSLSDGVKTICLKIPISHGSGGGGFREGYPLNNTVDVFKKWDADIHIMGHIHKLLAEDITFLTVGKNNELQNRVKWYCVGGCFLDTYKVGTRGYFESKKGMLSDIGFLELFAHVKNNKWNYEMTKHKYRNGGYE